MILRKGKPQKQNITNNEAETIKNLKNNKELMIMKEDKGNEMVVINSTDYEAKMVEHFTTTRCYKKLSKEPRARTIRDVTRIINKSSLHEGI